MQKALGSRRRILLISAALLAVLLLLIVFLSVDIAPPRNVTVTRAEVIIAGQGTDTAGMGWFGASPMNYSGAPNGFPFVDRVGQTFNFSIQMINNDAHPHNLSAAAVNAPFRLVGYTPTLPYYVADHEDFLMDLKILTPSQPGTYDLVITFTSSG
ncbi:MAG: hypothetical protein ACYDFT_02520 [Thermoplasmata archaeon]